MVGLRDSLSALQKLRSLFQKRIAAAAAAGESLRTAILGSTGPRTGGPPRRPATNGRVVVRGSPGLLSLKCPSLEAKVHDPTLSARP